MVSIHNFPPNLDPKLYTISAFIIAYALIGNFSALEQNAIGNWFMTIGQVLDNNAAWQQLMEARLQGGNININSQQFKETGNPFMNDKGWMDSPSDIELDKLKKTVEIMQEQLKKMQ